MIETLLQVDHDTEKRTYTVYYNGYQLELATPIRVDTDWGDFVDPEPRLTISFDCYELPPPPAPKPKRRASTHLGLRRPK